MLKFFLFHFRTAKYVADLDKLDKHDLVCLVDPKTAIINTILIIIVYFIVIKSLSDLAVLGLWSSRARNLKTVAIIKTHDSKMVLNMDYLLS